MTNENTDKIYPVSMLGAGVPSPNATPPDAPRSAPLPTQAVQQMRPPSPMQDDGGMSLLRALGSQQAPPVVPGLGFGSGVLSAMGGNPGANPYLTQQNQQAKDQFERNRQLTDMAQRFQDRQRQQQVEQSKLSLTVLNEALASTKDPAQRKNLLQQRSAIVQRLGGPAVPEETLTAMSENQFSTDDEKKILLGLMDSNPQAAKNVATQYGLTPRQVTYYQGLLKNDTALGAYGLPTADSLRKSKLDLQIKEAELAEKQHPELKGDPKLTQRALFKHQQLYGKSYLDGDADSQDRAFRMAIYEQRQQAVEDLIRTETIKAQIKAQVTGGKSIAESTAIFVDRNGNPAPSNLNERQAASAGYFKITPREFEQINSTQQAFTILQNMKHTVEEMKKEHLFVESSGLSGLYQQGQIATRRLLGDPATTKKLLGTWDSQKAQMVILLRQLGDKGVRALGAFAPAMEALNTTMGAQSVEQVMSQIESEIRSLGQKSRTPGAFTESPTVFTGPATSMTTLSPLNPAPAPSGGWGKAQRVN